MNRIPKVVVASVPRTGSTLICELLAQHPKLLGFGEIFIHEPKARKWFHKAASGDAHSYPGEGKLEPYLNYLNALAVLKDCERISFKLMDYQEPALWTYLHGEPQAYFVHARRTNALECCASSIAGEKSGLWHARTPKDQEKASLTTVRVEMPQLYQCHNRIAALDSKLNEYPHPKLVIEYEELGDVQAVANKIYDFIGVPSFMPSQTQGKLNVRPIRERVENYDELKEQCQETPLAVYFE